MEFSGWLWPEAFPINPVSWKKRENTIQKLLDFGADVSSLSLQVVCVCMIHSNSNENSQKFLTWLRWLPTSATSSSTLGFLFSSFWDFPENGPSPTQFSLYFELLLCPSIPTTLPFNIVSEKLDLREFWIPNMCLNNVEVDYTF